MSPQLERQYCGWQEYGNIHLLTKALASLSCHTGFACLRASRLLGDYTFRVCREDQASIIVTSYIDIGIAFHKNKYSSLKSWEIDKIM